MFNKTLASFVAVLFGFMSIGYLAANTNDYAPVPSNPDTRVAFIGEIYDRGDGLFALDADFIEWYEGEDAARVFLEREADSGLDGPPDGYYIVNDDTEVRRLTVAPDAEVYMQIYDRTGNIVEADIVWNERIDARRFVSLFRDGASMNMRDYPYHLTIENGVVTRITQQYIP